MNGKIDLHMHSNLSDGAYEPTELVRKAYDAGLSIISLTDHDSINGIKDAIMYGKELGVEVITGMEISTDLDDKEIHLLAYFIDIENDELTKYLISPRKKNCTETQKFRIEYYH